MEQVCGNCRYVDRDFSSLPCKHCSNGRYNGKTIFWQPLIEDSLDPLDRTYLMLELERLREELDKLIYIVKEKYKLEE